MRLTMRGLSCLAVPLLVVAPVAATAAAEGSEKAAYGKPLEGLPVASLQSILDRPEAGKRVRLEGSVARVCVNKGCWLELRQGERSVHVRFAGYSFFVPTDSAGRAVVLEGRVIVKEPRPEDVEHQQSEGAGAAAAASVSIEATGVELREK